MRYRTLAGFLVAFSIAVLVQAAEPLPTFQAADIHASAKTTNPYMRGGNIRGGRFQARNASMLELLSIAYHLDPQTILGGPNWLDTDRFDIVAGAPAATTDETAMLMLQSLLADRFKLVVHKDTKPMPVFVLSAGKAKHKMKQSDGSGSSGCLQQPNNVQGITGAFSVAKCTNMTMEALVSQIRNFVDQYLPNPVLDETAIKGAWDFELKWNPRNQLAAAGADGLTIFDAFDKQLGLKLEPQTRPQPVLIVDSVERNPTPNASDITSKLPPAPPQEFEIATVKLSPPDAPQRGIVEKGRVDLQGLNLKTLIQVAWDINPELIAGAPKFADDTKFAITGRAPIPEGATSEQEVDEDTLRLMVRNLLKERFKLATHTEDRMVEGYVMTASKPKLDKADPINRTECKEGPGKDGKDPRNTNPIMNRLMTCTNMTMAQFAEQLPLRVGGYVRTAVQNSTGIEGAWDFTISFSAINLYRANGIPGPDGKVPEPNGSLSFPDAMNKQLGIKVELQKRMMPVLVIDHLEEKPTEN